jgi:hypothetical protein
MFRFLSDRREAARIRRSAVVADVAFDRAAVDGANDPDAIRAVLKSARRDAVVLRLAESRFVRPSHTDSRARDALALVQHALDALPRNDATG